MMLNLVDLHTLVAEHGDVGHGTVTSDSLMEQGVVGRDKARRGQPVAKRVAQPVWHREWHEDREHEQHRERSREMLARVKQFDGDADIGIESAFPKLEFDQEFNQELKDCVCCNECRDKNSLGMWLRVQVCLRDSLRASFRVWSRAWIRVCLHGEGKCCAMALGNQLRVDNRDCKMNERTDCSHQCFSEQGKYKRSQRQSHHAVDANHTVEAWMDREQLQRMPPRRNCVNCGNW